MHSKWFGRIGLAALVTGIGVSSMGMTGCAAERDPINRVQLNAIPKSFFIGQNYRDPVDDPEFYARSMVIKVPYGESGSDFLMFTNTINMVSRIKWQVEEDQLIGRISYERITGTDSGGLTGNPNADRDPAKPLRQQDGVVVFQFRILSHFDIRRSYNAQTGEEANVIEENTSDRPWADRDYIRVDFSQNLNTTSYEFDTLSLIGVYNGITYTSAPFDVQNPADVNAPVIDVDKGYFDVTNKVFAQPQMLDLGGWVIPGCLLPNVIRGGTEPAGNCNANELTLRHSFKRVENTDYEAQDWDGFRFQAYGAFTTDRNGYARDYGLADSKWKRYISRYNIWERSHVYEDMENMAKPKACKFDEQCSDVGGVRGISHCDKLAEMCTLPYTQRKAKTIYWHYADGSPAEYFDATREATEEWDTAMRIAVQAAKYAECTRFGLSDDCAAEYKGVVKGNFSDEEDAMYLVKEVNACRRDAAEKGTDVAACDALAESIGEQRGYSQDVRDLAKLTEMVVLCHSPVDKTDPKGCGEVGEVARLGDLRHHLVTAIQTPETRSPWGIMSDGNDPVTGEHVAASINVWTHVNDLFSRGIIDTLRYIGGELSTEQVTDGTHIDQWIEAARRQQGVGMNPLMSKDEFDGRIAAAAGTTLEKMRAVEAQQVKVGGKLNPTQIGEKAALRRALENNMKRVSQTFAAVDAPSYNAPLYEARMALGRNTKLEAELAGSPAMQQLAQSAMGDLSALKAATKNPGSSMQAASVLSGMNPMLRRNLENRIESALAARGACVMNYEATAPLGYVQLADILQQKFGHFNKNDSPDVQLARADRMKDWLRRRAHYAVISHEMGHSFALRHNFVSSSDAWNFRPQYWALRTNAKKANEKCPDTGGGDGKACVGPRWLDKVTDNEANNMIHMWAQSSTMEYAGEPSQDLLGLGAYDFAAARMFYGESATVYADSRFRQSEANGACAVEHLDEFGGLLGYRYCDFGSPVHYSHLDAELSLIEKCESNVNPEAFKPPSWNAAQNGEWNPIIDGHLVTNEEGKWTRCKQPKVDFVQWDSMKSTSDKSHAYDAKNRARVPHGFATDGWADLGNVAVYRHDNGADIYETMHFWIAQQEMNHIFTNYRRSRRDFSIWGAFNRTLSRYHEKMRDSAKAIGLYGNLARDSIVVYNYGTNPEAEIADTLKKYAAANTVASSIAFDHFAHVFARPQPSPHGIVGSPDDNVLRSFDGTGLYLPQGKPLLSVANGVSGGFGTISLAGRPIENALARDRGNDYNRDYTLNVGSYYEKAFTSYLFTESADNFISSSRDDFVDPRFRAVSIADIFPDGYRRWLANNLTGDDAIKGVVTRGKGGGAGVQPPDLDADGYALLGTTAWWPKQGIAACFPQADYSISCFDPFGGPPPNNPAGPTVDPQVGWEQQKFALILSIIFLPENQKTNWLDMMRIYDVSSDNDPGFENRIEFHDPNGKIYMAQTFGTETLFGKTVQRGIAARMLEYANELLQKSVVTTPIVKNGVTVGYQPVLVNGTPTYKQGAATVASCDQSRDCSKMKDYTALPKLMHEAMHQLGWTRVGGLKGVY